MKILVVTVNWLGDAIMTTPAFKALKEAHPQAYVAVMGPERVCGVFENNPWVDEVISFNERTTHRGLLKKIGFIRQLRKKQFDTVFLIHRSLTRALICWLAGIGNRIGYCRKKTAWLLTKAIAPLTGKCHRQDSYLHLFEAAGITIKDRMPQLFVNNEAQQKIKQRLAAVSAESKNIVVINPSANWEPKRWPAPYFAEVADKLAQQLHSAIIFIGAQKDQKIVTGVREQMNEQSYDFCGKTTLTELIALLAQADLVISNDSGPSHMAAALATPTLILFGPTSSKITGARGKAVTILSAQPSECEIPCYNQQCLDNECMKAITVEQVFAVAVEMLSGVENR